MLGRVHTWRYLCSLALASCHAAPNAALDASHAPVAGANAKPDAALPAAGEPAQTDTPLPAAGGSAKADASMPQPATPDAATPAPDALDPMRRGARCVSEGRQAALIGDSYITGFGSPQLQPELDALLEPAGLVTGYSNYAVAGAGMASGGISEPDLIPRQFDRALAASGDLRLVIMDGGGADWLLPPPGNPDCKSLVGSAKDPSCQEIVATAVRGFSELMMRMAQSGVRDVIFFGLPHFQGNGGLRGTNPNEMIEYAHPLEQAACEAALARTGTLACHYIDLRKFHDVENFSHVVDGSHPSLSMQRANAREIYAIMKRHCLGHPTSSGCCTP